MIKLFSLKQQKKDGESPRSGPQKKASAAQLRIQKGEKLKNSFNLNYIWMDFLDLKLQLKIQ